jgi:hypothetical protein
MAVDAETLTTCTDTVWRRWLGESASFTWNAHLIRLSPMLLWHRSEWDADGGWRRALALLTPAAVQPLLQRDDIPVEYTPFDWTLNDSRIPAGAYRGMEMLWDRLRWSSP